MRPMIRPGLAFAWRSADTLQLGIDDPRPLIVSGLPAYARVVLALMDGVRTHVEIASTVATISDSTASTNSEDSEQTASVTDDVRDMIDRLLELGAVIDAGRWPGAAAVPLDAHERLLPDLAALGSAEPDHWWVALSTTSVTVLGASRLGAIIASSLVASGVGQVTVADPRPVTLADIALGGFTTHDLGHRRAELLSLHPERRATPEPDEMATRSLVVVTDAIDADTAARDLAAEGITHLVTSCRERLGRVGPFVVPGTSPCQFCLYLHRRDHDPAWSQIWRQRTWPASPAAHGPTAAVTASLAVAHILTWIAGDRPPSTSQVIEVAAPECTITSRPSVVHPECGCSWSADRATMAG